MKQGQPVRARDYEDSKWNDGIYVCKYGKYHIIDHNFNPNEISGDQPQTDHFLICEKRDDTN